MQYEDSAFPAVKPKKLRKRSKEISNQKAFLKEKKVTTISSEPRDFTKITLRPTSKNLYSAHQELNHKLKSTQKSPENIFKQQLMIQD